MVVASDGYEGLEKAVGEYPDIIQSRRGLAISGSAALFAEKFYFSDNRQGSLRLCRRPNLKFRCAFVSTNGGIAARL